MKLARHSTNASGSIALGSASTYNIRYNHPLEATMKLKITTIGNSAGVILPRELLARLRLEKGDELFALETPDGIRLTTYDPTLAKQMEVAEEVMRKRRTLLHKLAQ
jgi:putative addiction module antidote